MIVKELVSSFISFGFDLKDEDVDDLGDGGSGIPYLSLLSFALSLYCKAANKLSDSLWLGFFDSSCSSFECSFL